MIELFTILATLLLVFAVAVVFFKVLIWLILLPVKMGFWLLKGLVAAVLFIPALIISIGAASIVLPIVASLIAVPVVFVVAGVVMLLKILF